MGTLTRGGGRGPAHTGAGGTGAAGTHLLRTVGCVVAPPPVTPVPSPLPQAHRGIKGMVVDKFGKPVRNARVSVKGIRHDVTTGELLPGLAAAATASTSTRHVPGLAVSPGWPRPQAGRVPELAMSLDWPCPQAGRVPELATSPGSSGHQGRPAGNQALVSLAASRRCLARGTVRPGPGCHGGRCVHGHQEVTVLGRATFSKMTGACRSQPGARVPGVASMGSGTSQPIWWL